MSTVQHIEQQKASRIIIAGGGTGGHIFPAIAIANAIRKKSPDTKFLFVGAKGKMEMEKVPQAGYEITGIDIAGFNRSSLIKNIGLPFKLVKSFIQVRSILKNFAPDAVIGVGGYSSYPVLRTAQAKGIPSFIHESNSFAGKANIMLGKKATQIFVASEGMEKFFPAGKIVITGNPIRSSIAAAKHTQAEGLAFFGLKEGYKTILVTGGSLGAQSINEAIAAALPQLEAEKLQLIWQTGKGFASQAAALCEGKPAFFTSAFIREMEMAFAAADLVVSRAGAMAMAELCVVQKPVIFVPYPHAAEDHQTANAKMLVQKEAALMIPDAEVRTRLGTVLIALANDTEQQKKMTVRMAPFAIADADEKIAGNILAHINKQ